MLNVARSWLLIRVVLLAVLPVAFFVSACNNGEAATAQPNTGPKLTLEQVNYDVELNIQRCMAEEGFEYFPRVMAKTPETATGEDFLAMGYADTIGYGFVFEVTQHFGNAKNAQLVPEDRDEARLYLASYNQALSGESSHDERQGEPGGCQQQAVEMLSDSAKRYLANRDAERLESAKTIGAVSRSREFLDFQENWSGCMVEAGYEYVPQYFDYYFVLAQEYGLPASREAERLQDENHPVAIELSRRKEVTFQDVELLAEASPFFAEILDKEIAMAQQDVVCREQHGKKVAALYREQLDADGD